MSQNPKSWSELIKSYDADRKRFISTAPPSYRTHRDIKAKESVFNPVTQTLRNTSEESKLNQTETTNLYQKIKVGYERQLKYDRSTHDVVTNKLKPGVIINKQTKQVPRLANVKASLAGYNIIAPPPHDPPTSPLKVYKSAKTVDYDIINPPPVIDTPRKILQPPKTEEKPRGKRILNDRSTRELKEVVGEKFKEDPFPALEASHRSLSCPRNRRNVEAMMQTSGLTQTERLDDQRLKRFRRERFLCNEYTNGFNLISGETTIGGIGSRQAPPLRVADKPSLEHVLLSQSVINRN
ncbi:hypothetical protein RCL1_002537 [Eukaryota sp. TZLM3-RCL]